MALPSRKDPVHEIRDRLHDRAHVFDHPDSYLAGVEDALGKIEELQDDDRRQ